MITRRFTRETGARGTNHGREFFIDTIIHQNETVPNATKYVIRLDRLKGIANVSIAAVGCKC